MCGSFDLSLGILNLNTYHEITELIAGLAVERAAERAAERAVQQPANLVVLTIFENLPVGRSGSYFTKVFT